MGMIERAVADGATLVVGGNRMDRPGYYIEPTVLTDVDPSSEIAQIEVFGPVVAITKFSTDEEAIAIANSTRYGLSSYIQTKDLTRAHRIAAELEAGEVLINGAPNLAVHRPFGGIGISGVGQGRRPRRFRGVPAREERRHRHPLGPLCGGSGTLSRRDQRAATSGGPRMTHREGRPPSGQLCVTVTLYRATSP